VSVPYVIASCGVLQIYLDFLSESRHFRKHIKSYNHVFSFTSLGVHMDEHILIQLAQEPNVHHECIYLLRSVL